jgi:hypothetical protein
MDSAAALLQTKAFASCSARRFVIRPLKLTRGGSVLK